MYYTLRFDPPFLSCSLVILPITANVIKIMEQPIRSF